MPNNVIKKRTNKEKAAIDPIIRSIDKVLVGLHNRRDSHESFVNFLFHLFAHPDYTVEKMAETLGKSKRMVKYYRAAAYEKDIIKEYKWHYSGFQRPITAVDKIADKALRNEARSAVLGYLKQRATKEEFLRCKKQTEENRKRIREERKNKDRDGDNSGDNLNLPLHNGKPFSRDSSTTNKKFIQSELIKNLSFSMAAIPWFAKKFNIDRKITEKIIFSDFKRIEYEIITLGRKYKSPIAVLIARIKQTLRLAKKSLEKGQTFFIREERQEYNLKPKVIKKVFSELERFKRTLEEQRERNIKHALIEKEATDHDWSLIINSLNTAGTI